MALHVALTHRTTYRYDRAVTLGPQTIRLRPAPHARTPILAYSLLIEPAGHFLNWQQDPGGNHLARVVFPERVTHFDVTVDLIADMATINPFDFFLEPEAASYPFAYDPQLAHELAPYRRLDAPTPRFAALLAAAPRQMERTVDHLVALNQLVQSRVAYIVRMEPGVFAPERTLTDGQGSCRDSAWLLVQLLRHLGYAARFVSGYLIQLRADQAPLEGPAGPTTDFTDLHAWAEAFLPGAGWIGLDATSGLLAGEGHIPLAATPEPQSAAPISGGVEPSGTEFGVEMTVRRVRETPRTSLPYGEADWAAILAAGDAVDRTLAAGDVRLTMGGEPTFVATTDLDAGEWTIDALGPTKRRHAGALLRKLAALWAPGAALQYSAGKQYPGEQLPRWALHAHWRGDGEPAWRDATLFADPDRDDGDADAGTAAAFAAALAQRLQVAPEHVLPAYEDVQYYLWRERRLPANVDAEDSRLRDPQERARLTRIFAGAIGASVGSVLPLRRVAANGHRRWQSGRWPLRGNTLFLIPGDSAIGFRLPLDSLPHAEEDVLAREAEQERDPFAPRPPLPRAQPYAAGAAPPSAPGSFAAVPQKADAAGVIRTALTVEARGGLLHVFVPPLYVAEDWLDLVAAIEATAAETGRKLVLEGYPPPRDPRVKSFSVTPDPGVIEVNIHPAASWREGVERTEQLYAAARATGLQAEKFMLDGRHVGTGGGNHVVMGAATPADSPFLRRPDLLKSLLGFWQNHPALSYLFSGLFIGPTSQHPRVDEARDDALAELEIAFAQVARSRTVPPWLTDRLFRNLLVDMTGNTHRTEFCIDKLYAPEGGTGRLGLVEYRGMEMPPDPRMAAAGQLLLRAAIAAFWDRPYTRRMVRWGSRLHDAFLLPHYVEEDLRDALDDLAAHGQRLDPAWYAPQLAFRFPVLGETAVRGMTLELRHALEPWHVLGEDPAAGGTVRYVDSSTERLQVRVTDWVPERFVLACNGRAVPLAPTEVAGEYVAGVRFKAWAPPAALHPTVPAQTPLVFDVWDGWSRRALGGARHYAAHPGGRSYATFPVNAQEAEARRRERFQAFGHTPDGRAGSAMPLPPSTSAERPRTLDLRR